MSEQRRNVQISTTWRSSVRSCRSSFHLSTFNINAYTYILAIYSLFRVYIFLFVVVVGRSQHFALLLLLFIVDSILFFSSSLLVVVRSFTHTTFAAAAAHTPQSTVCALETMKKHSKNPYRKLEFSLLPTRLYSSSYKNPTARSVRVLMLPCLTYNIDVESRERNITWTNEAKRRKMEKNILWVFVRLGTTSTEGSTIQSLLSHIFNTIPTTSTRILCNHPPRLSPLLCCIHIYLYIYFLPEKKRKKHLNIFCCALLRSFVRFSFRKLENGSEVK